VATAVLVAGYLLDTLGDYVCINQLILKRRSMMTTLFNWSSLSDPWRPKRRQSMITALTTLPQGRVLARKHQCATAITTMWTESSWAFLRATLPDRALERWRTTGRQKGS